MRRPLLPALGRSGKDASIIFISSIAALATASGWGAYSASKAGLNALMRCLAGELRHLHAKRVDALSWSASLFAQTLSTF